MEKIFLFILVICFAFCTYTFACDTPYLVTAENLDTDAYEITGLGSQAIMELPENHQLHHDLSDLDPGFYTATIRQLDLTLGWSLPKDISFTIQAPMPQVDGLEVVYE